jgi:hypothetical protein
MFKFSKIKCHIHFWLNNDWNKYMWIYEIRNFTNEHFLQIEHDTTSIMKMKIVKKISSSKFDGQQWKFIGSWSKEVGQLALKL